MKHFMCTHSYLSGDAKENIINQLRGITDREFLDMNSGKNARVLQHWAGKDEFFFCHWEAENEDDIHEVLSKIGADKFIITLANEMQRYVTHYDIKDEKINIPEDE